MTNLLLAVLLLLSLFGTVYAQQDSVLLIGTGFRGKRLTNSQIQYARDGLNGASKETLPSQQMFQPVVQPVLVFGGYREPVWLRFSVLTKTPVLSNYILDVSYLGLDGADVYVQDSLDRIQKLLRVTRRQFVANRPIPDNRLLFRLTFRPNERYRIYVRVPRRYERHVVSLRLWNEQFFLADTLVDRSIFFLLVGGLMLAIVAGLSLFATLRERIYWQYSLYVFSLCLVILVMSGYADPYVLTCKQLLFDHTTSLATFFSIGCHVALSNTYLAAKQLSRWLLWIGRSIMISSFIFMTFFFLPVSGIHSILIRASYEWLIIAELYILLLVLLNVRQGYKPALIYFIRFLPFIVGLPILFNLQLVQSISQFVELLLVASVFEVLFLGAGIGLSYFETRKARIVLAEQLYKTQEQVIQIQEFERQRIAADLHDELGGTLSTIKGQLETVHMANPLLARPINLMEKAIRDLRHISHNLMPPEFTKLGLVESVRETVRQVEAGSTVQFIFITYGQERRLPNESELIIYRIAVELITNTIKHAKAKQVTIQLLFYPQYVSLLVEDDGQGYPIDEQNDQSGIGMRTIRSRAAYLQAVLLVDSGERGTISTLEVPL